MQFNQNPGRAVWKPVITVIREKVCFLSFFPHMAHQVWVYYYYYYYQIACLKKLNHYIITTVSKQERFFMIAICHSFENVQDYIFWKSKVHESQHESSCTVAGEESEFAFLIFHIIKRIFSKWQHCKVESRQVELSLSWTNFSFPLDLPFL